MQAASAHSALSRLTLIYINRYDLGVMGGALLGISDELATSDWADGLIVGAAKLGACFGAFLGGALMLHYGRRIAITIDSVLFMLGPIVMATSAGAT